MKIKKEVAITLMRCVEQINHFYGCSTIEFEKNSKFKLFMNSKDEFFIFTKSRNKSEINSFIEEVFYLIRRGSLLPYPPVKLSSGKVVRFDGFDFISSSERKRFSDFNPADRKEYFEKCGIK